MYAVVSTGGKQLKVEKGTEAVVEKLDAAVGDVVTFDVIFIADGDTVITDSDQLASATVSAEVTEHFKGEKQIVFKFKKRKGYKRTKGHRQPYTRVRVTEIVSVGAPKKTKKAEKPAAKKAETKAAPKSEPKAEKPAVKAEDKPAAKKAEKPAAAVEKKAEPKSESKAKKAEKAPAADLDSALCQAIKGNGEQCQNKPKDGSKYCGVHAKKYEG